MLNKIKMVAKMTAKMANRSAKMYNKYKKINLALDELNKICQYCNKEHVYFKACSKYQFCFLIEVPGWEEVIPWIWVVAFKTVL